MTRKLIKCFVVFVVIFFVAWHSIYFRKLDAMKQANSQKGFNASQYARSFFDDKLSTRIDSAIDINNLFLQLKADPAVAFASH